MHCHLIFFLSIFHVATTAAALVHTGEGEKNGNYWAAPLVELVCLGEQLSRWLSHFRLPYMSGCSFSCGDIGGLVCTMVLVAPSSLWHAGGSSSNKGNVVLEKSGLQQALKALKIK